MQPLTFGSILIVGAKSSNFDDEIKRNPRVAMWSSEEQNWNSKELPVNTRAVFFTRWVGHADFAHIVKEARKKRITIFTPAGTGVIAKNVKELLGLNKEVITTIVTSPNHNHKDIVPMNQNIITTKEPVKNKLKPLHEHIDLSKTDKENGVILYAKAQELGIQTTLRSVQNTVYLYRMNQKKQKKEIPNVAETSLDVSVQILDDAIKALRDVREFLLSTTKENRALRTKIEKFKKFIED